MKALGFVLRLAIGVILGAIPGIVFLLAGEERQGLGLVAIGGLLGFVCALTPYFYHTTSWHLTQRGFLLFVKTMLGYNLPGGDKLVAMEDIEFDARGIGTNHARFEMLKGIGGRYGFLVGLPAGLIAAHYFPL